MKVEVHRHQCMGAGLCTQRAPEVFDQDEDDGIVILLEAEPAEDQQAAVREAAFVCPSRAIEVTETEG